MKTALEICLNHEITAEEQFQELSDLGLDLEDIFDIAMKAAEIEVKYDNDSTED
jgi:hypothetical protein